MKRMLLFCLLLGMTAMYGTSAKAGCEGTYLGASSKNPIMSSVDITFSPV
ncbi:MAG: hypothetical protein HQM12_15985, partial [SAR324 cluster bacterium]|nr:hypothetical protein [SAR324 cluster bacterium]